MPIAHIDVLVTVPPAKPPYWLSARARRVVALPEASVPAATLAELRARLPRLVAVFGDGAPTVAVAAQVHAAGLPLLVFTDDPALKAPTGIDVRPATDPGQRMEVADSLLDLVGETPLLALHRTARGVACHFLAKLEYLNPGGSVKDRPALAMIDDGRAGRQAVAGRHHRRAHLRQYRRWLGHGGCPARLPLHIYDAGQDRQRKDATAACVRGGSYRLPDGGGAGAPGVLLLGGQPAHGFDAGSVPT